MQAAADAADFSAQLLLPSMVIVKATGTGGEVTCHQDSTFLLCGAGKLLRLSGRARRRDDENGCMAFLPDEHKGALRRIFRRTGESAEMETLSNDPSSEHRAVAAPVSVGDLVVFAALTPHYPRWTWLQRPAGTPLRES